MPTNFFTNDDDNTLIKRFQGTFENITNLTKFDALVGYFQASGYFNIRPFMSNIKHIRILVGISVDKLTKKYANKGQLYISDGNEAREQFINEMIQNVQDADYDSDTENGIIDFLNDIASNRIELRTHPDRKIHAKVYIMRPDDFNQYSTGEVITGSSNFTNPGLGTYNNSNYEFNVALKNFEDTQFALGEFEKLWEQSVPILQSETDAVKKKTYIRDNFTPFEIYIKMLIEYFGKRVEYDPFNIELMLPDKYMRLKYQTDAANQGYAIMMKHNGFLLADVVGLGKTIIACMVIKKFIYENGNHTKILVVVPPAIESNWRETVKAFGLENHFFYITTGSLGKILDENENKYPGPEEYDLVVIDESHQFRNFHTIKYNELQEICKAPRQKAAEKGDNKKKVILVSATPLNNRPEDIENQLYLFQDKRQSTLENIRNLQEYFKGINAKFKELANAEEQDLPGLRSLFEKLRNDIIEPLVIRRTRKDIENNKEYLVDLEAQNLVFPKVKDPIALYYLLDDELSELFFDTVSLITGLDESGKEIEGLGFYRYRAIEYLINEEDRNIYGNVRQISKSLAAIMRTLLVKRLESSFYAFKCSLGRLSTAVQNMLNMIDNDNVFIAPDLDVNKLLEKGLTYDEIQKIIEKKGENNKVFPASAFDSEFYNLLVSDKKKIDGLLARWNKVTVDPKLIEFAKQIADTFFIKKNNPSEKLVIFTESTETAKELAAQIENISRFKNKILQISSENRKDKEHIIRQNFDANLDEEKWNDQYKILITTEVLAEGINLHRSNIIVNYDVPWNSTKLMQRIGRVNRIGSRHPEIFVYNFYPSAQGDKQIRLIRIALRKLQAFHSAFGEDNKIFSLLEETNEAALYGNQIRAEESETLKYLIELRDFRKKDPKRFKEIEKIPNKARCGRDVQNISQQTMISDENIKYEFNLKNASLAYLKSDNHPGVFCLVTESMATVELNFLQAVKIYKANEEEKAIELHHKHYEQVIESLNFFEGEKNQQNIQTITAHNLSPDEKKAISNLNAMLNIAPTEQKQVTLKRAIDAIKYARQARTFHKNINSFFKSNSAMMKEPQKFLDKLFIDVLNKTELNTNIDNSNAPQDNVGIINPKIVLTQSFK